MSRKHLISAAACAVVVLAGCGSNSSSTKHQSASNAGESASPTAPSTGPAGTAGTGTASASGAAIRLGSICSCTGPQAGVLADEGTLLQAWAGSVNGSGGINGHRVSVTVLDDGGDPARSLQDAKQLVEHDHVMAIVGEVSTADASWARYVASKGVPVVGGLAAEAPFLTNPDFFPSGTQVVVQMIGTATVAKQAGAKHFGLLYCAEAPVCAQLVPLAQAGAKLNGMQFSSLKVSATAPSYLAPCLALKSAGVDSFYIGDNGFVAQRVVDGCAQQGYKPTIVQWPNAIASTWLKDPNTIGTLMASNTANIYDTSVPGIAKLQALIKKNLPGLPGSSEFTQNLVYPWVGGELFAAAANAAHITPTSTGADVKRGLYALKGETLDGVAPPLTYTPGKPAFIPCYFTSKIADGSIVSANGGNATCLSATELKALAAALHM